METRGRVGMKTSEVHVLVHGLGGSSVDLSYLKQKLEERGGGSVRVLCVRCNEGRTKDGVERGSRRLAEEVREFVRDQGDLRRISFVGNSLGGIYSRYACAILYQPCESVEKGLDCICGCGGRGRIAGLIPGSMVTIATPHLGIRRFKFLNLPDFIYSLIARKTGQDLLLQHSSCCRCGLPLLAKMAGVEHESTCYQARVENRDEAAGDPLEDPSWFIRALNSFSRRRLYANICNDLLVLCGTASISLNSPPLDNSSAGNPSLRGPEKESSDSAGEPCTWLDPTTQVEHLKVVVRNEGCYPNQDSRIHFHRGLYEENCLEECMAKKLNSLSWEKFYVEYPGLPYAHAVVSANRRLFPSLVSGRGRPLMDQLAEHLLQS